MTAFANVRFDGDPPQPGEAKLRIRGNGDPMNLEVVVVDDTGTERTLMGATAVAFEWRIGNRSIDQKAIVTVREAEVDVAVDHVAIARA